MCEILAINARRTMRVDASLGEFFDDSPRHPHGWGLSWRRDDGSLWLDKEPLPAYGSEYLSYLLQGSIRTSWLVAHIRNATRGVVTYENCHPFRGVDASGACWVLAHNGTMLAEDDIERLAGAQRGTTDSERVLLRLIALLDGAAAAADGTPLGFDATFGLLANAVATLSAGNKLNLAFGDGTYTFAHTNTLQRTLWHRLGGGVATICTRPLGEGDGWVPVPRCRLVAYRDGEVVAVAKQHDNAFDDDEYLRIIERERQENGGGGLA